MVLIFGVCLAVSSEIVRQMMGIQFNAIVDAYETPAVVQCSINNRKLHTSIATRWSNKNVRTSLRAAMQLMYPKFWLTAQKLIDPIDCIHRSLNSNRIFIQQNSLNFSRTILKHTKLFFIQFYLIFQLQDNSHREKKIIWRRLNVSDLMKRTARNVRYMTLSHLS